MTNAQSVSEIKHPLVTFVILSYNQERYLGEAIESALLQNYSPLEIIISDDCSTDRSLNIAEEIVSKYSGKHSILINKNSSNIGLGANVNRAWELASGDIVIIQAGDDVSVPSRTSAIVDVWQKTNPPPDLVFSSVVLVDENGNKIGERTDVSVPPDALIDTITGKKEYVTGGCCSAYSKSLHWTTGPLNEDTIAEDFIYTFRALLGNGIVGIEEPLVFYRQHDASIMGKSRNRTDNKLRNLVGRRSRLIEYRKAMEAYRFSNLYLRWRLNRRIRTFDLAIRTFEVGLAGKVWLAIQSLVTLRFELVPGAFRLALDKISPGWRISKKRYQ